jgi:hypothetical protein
MIIRNGNGITYYATVIGKETQPLLTALILLIPFIPQIPVQTNSKA